MKSESNNRIDGTYRRLYSAALRGRRINSVAPLAELLFWRMHMVADDFGNLIVSPDLAPADLFPLRRFQEGEVETWMKELAAAGLIELYRDGEESYAHIVDWERFQPPPRNGRRVHRVPSPAGDPVQPGVSRCSRGGRGDSGGVRGKPGESRAPTPTPIPIPIPTTTTTPPPSKNRPTAASGGRAVGGGGELKKFLTEVVKINLSRKVRAAISSGLTLEEARGQWAAVVNETKVKDRRGLFVHRITERGEEQP